MVSNIEEQFFKTFDIPKLFSMDINIGDLDANWITVTEPTLKKLWDNHRWDIGNEAGYVDPDEEKEEIPTTFKEFKKSNFWREEYPEITAEILLELIGFLNVTYNKYESTGYSPFALKIDILKQIINAEKDKEWIYTKVRELFELKN